MPYNGDLKEVTQEMWDKMPQDMKDRSSLCEMPQEGVTFTHPGKVVAISSDNRWGYNCRALGWKNNEFGTEPDWTEPEDGVAYFGAIWSPYKMWIIEEDTVMLKIVEFGDETTVSESMWVTVIEGDSNEGIGRLENQPSGIPWLQFGDTIRYGGGTQTSKARFIEKVEE